MVSARHPHAPLPPPRPEAARWLAAMADALPWPLLCVAEDGRLLHGNRAALAGLAQGGPLLLTAERRVVARRVRQRPALRAALARALAGQAEVLAWPGLPALAVQPLQAGPGGEPVVMLAIAAPPAPDLPHGQ